MVVESEVLWVLVFGILMEGVWLSGITYMMWKRFQGRKEEPVEAEEAAPARL